jgi:hypothetical protein
MAATIAHMSEYHAIISEETCMRLRIFTQYSDSVRAQIIQEFPKIISSRLGTI